MLISLEIARNTKLTPPSAKLLYGRLILYAGKNGACTPSHETLADEIAVSARQVARLLRELRDCGLITWHRRRTSSSFSVNPPESFRCPVQTSVSGHVRTSTSGLVRTSMSDKKMLVKRGSLKDVKPDYDCLPTLQKTLEVQSDPALAYLKEYYPQTQEALRAHLGVDDPPSVVKTLKIIQAAGSPPEHEILTALENFRLRGYSGDYVRTYAYLETALADEFQRQADRREVSAPRGYRSVDYREDAIAQTAAAFDFASRNGAR